MFRLYRVVGERTALMRAPRSSKKRLRATDETFNCKPNPITNIPEMKLRGLQFKID